MCLTGIFHIIAQIWLWPHSFRNGSGLLGLERLWLKEFFFLRLTHCSPLQYVLRLLRHTIYPFMAILLHLTSSHIFFGPVGTLTDYWQVVSRWQWHATCFCKRLNQSYMVVFTFFFFLSYFQVNSLLAPLPCRDGLTLCFIILSSSVIFPQGNVTVWLQFQIQMYSCMFSSI